MFMVVGFPWPVASAHVELTGRKPTGDVPARHDAPGSDRAQPELVGAGRTR